ncbi:hypothetical protein Val02_40310 [Virgisporangium aliadipatigenens]|uniref:Uncharacterized protein n=1 Tax=Virgisporangium aliadipatigenens TaxID=741659 RepID=A0A8J3YNK0_9ACTN|nr:hypothetical protein Val02_40310 [Virgisporangium aliadipatigenens]
MRVRAGALGFSFSARGWLRGSGFRLRLGASVWDAVFVASTTRRPFGAPSRRLAHLRAAGVPPLTCAADLAALDNWCTGRLFRGGVETWFGPPGREGAAAAGASACRRPSGSDARTFTCVLRVRRR